MNLDGRILILTKEAKTAQELSVALERQGLQTVASGDTAQAAGLMDENPFDLIVAESELKGASGLQFLAEMRARHPLTLRVLIQNGPIPDDMAMLINDAAPVGLYKDDLSSDVLLRLLARECPVRQGSGNGALGGSADESEYRKVMAENTLLLREISKLRQENERLRSEGPSEASGEPVSQGSIPPPRHAPDSEEAQLIDEMSTYVDQMMDTEIVLPVLPPVGLEVQKMVQDDNCSFEELAHRVELEQGMSARILQVANSPIYAGLKRINSLQQAVSRLGLRETRNILQTVVAENLFKTKSKALMRLMARLWMHSLSTAHANESIARHMRIAESDDFFMMGLLHDLGKLVILTVVERGLAAEKWSRRRVTEAMILDLMDARHHEVGMRLLEDWQYPQTFRDVVAHHNDDANIHTRPEWVVVTYYSNLLTRRLGYSLVPDINPELLKQRRLAEALNINEGTRLLLESSIQKLVEKVRSSYFGPGG